MQELLDFLDQSPTAWHAVEAILKKLQPFDFEILNENHPWKLKPGGRYVVTRNGSTLAAFVVPQNAPIAAKLAGAHTDSPGFKLKPQAEYVKENMVMLGVEVYGSPLLSSWLNRDLGIAGRVVFKEKGKIHEKLVDIKEHPVVIPQLAIHLDRGVNENGLILNKQDHLAALAGLDHKKKYLESVLKEKFRYQTLLAHDLFLYPLERARFVGLNQEFIASYRIDNLGSVYAILQALLKNTKPDKDHLKLAIFWDNEEIGSETSQGAASPFVPHLMERICLSLGLGREEYMCLINQSLCLSVDQTHALHPNYPDKHEPRHMILMDKGIVIKSNAQNRYATNARSAALVADLCDRLKLPYQEFVSRNDISSGTTIGPIHSHLTGMPTVDIGYPQLSMHSCRELACIQDHVTMCTLLHEFFK